MNGGDTELRFLKGGDGRALSTNLRMLKYGTAKYCTDQYHALYKRYCPLEFATVGFMNSPTNRILRPRNRRNKAPGNPLACDANSMRRLMHRWIHPRFYSHRSRRTGAGRGGQCARHRDIWRVRARVHDCALVEAVRIPAPFEPLVARRLRLHICRLLHAGTNFL